MNQRAKTSTGRKPRRVQAWFKSHKRTGIFLIAMLLLAGVGFIKWSTEKETIVVKPYTTGSVTSHDGTVIGYRQFGHGPGLILVHGGMMASQNFTRLASALSDDFTVYVPDRRGRGLSGPYGDNYSIQKEVEDMQALIQKTGASNVFGLSAGAIVVLQSTLAIPSIDRIAVYEPPFFSDTAWVARLDREIAQGNLAAAMITVVKGTEDPSPLGWLPRFITERLMTLAINAEATEVKGDDVPLKELIPTMHYDPRLVDATRGNLESYRAISARVLLLGGSQSPNYLRVGLDTLSTILPNAIRVELLGVGHLAADNEGKPEAVAQELLRFFSGQHD